MAAERHFPALDGLRGLAILLVIPHNTDVFTADSGLWPVAALAHAGWIGVQLFFVLSGFLITSNLLDNQQSTSYYRSFFARRTLRILPLYYGVLIVALVVIPRLVALPPQASASQEHQVWLWTFLVNWVQPFGRTVEGFPHFWSLAVEEQFYLLWPFLMRRRSPQGAWLLCLALIIGALLIRCGMLAAGAKSEMVYMFTFCRMDALAAGAACAAALRMRRCAELIDRHAGSMWMFGIGLGILGAIVTRLYAVYSFSTFTVGYTLLSSSFALLVLGAVVQVTARNRTYQQLLSARPLRSVGKYSYAMYVFHMPIQIVAGASILPHLKATGSIHPLLYSASIALLSYLAAFASYHLYEKHFLKLKRFFPTTANVAPSSRVQQAAGVADGRVVNDH